ncbi:4-hydroxythreonine-4-phosphate dehydrogenase PdxA [Streptomyces sp. NPDC006617]|uniref:4-hydroxythreonine-4-phosphate dehydrogenase PdxA n=1 Tax=Streptomyces sp. NPDC006617 TaxID=3155354 RepID=UPI0033A2332A
MRRRPEPPGSGQRPSAPRSRAAAPREHGAASPRESTRTDARNKARPGRDHGVHGDVGNPLVRDHGTALDIAGTGKAEASSMIEALRQAAEMSTARRLTYREGRLMPPNGSQVRREEILRLATTTGLASVEELSRHFGVTASTIRRRRRRPERPRSRGRRAGPAPGRGGAGEPPGPQRA